MHTRPGSCSSIRVPGKNTRLLGDVPLISYTIRAAQESKLLDDYFVSTEDPKIRDLTLSYGCPVLNRPLSLAQDDTTTGEVAAHAVEAMEGDGHKFDAVVILHPTSPFRTAQHIDEAIAHYEEGDLRAHPALASVEFIPKKRHANVFAGGNWAKGGIVMNAAIYILDCEHIKKTR